MKNFKDYQYDNNIHLFIYYRDNFVYNNELQCSDYLNVKNILSDVFLASISLLCFITICFSCLLFHAQFDEVIVVSFHRRRGLIRPGRIRYIIFTTHHILKYVRLIGRTFDINIQSEFAIYNFNN